VRLQASYRIDCKLTFNNETMQRKSEAVLSRKSAISKHHTAEQTALRTSDDFRADFEQKFYSCSAHSSVIWLYGELIV
jgi:hypothetical protein